YGSLHIGGALLQHVAGDLVLRSRMPYAQAQAHEVVAAMPDRVADTVVPAVTPALLQARHPRRKIYFVMRYQQLVRIQPVVVENRPDRAAAQVHVALRLYNPRLTARKRDLANLCIESLLIAK